MTIKITTTAQSAGHVKCLVYGDSGIGKTTLCKTAPNPIIISAERGLLSLDDVEIPTIEIENHLDLQEAYRLITTDENYKGVETVCLDSISDIGESILSYFKKNPVDGNSHPQAAYGSLADELLPMIKKFRDIEGKNVYFTAKCKRMTDEYSGITSWIPSMPGKVLADALPYLFDFLLPMRMGKTKENEDYRYLQTKADLQWIAKDRSGKLSDQEQPDLGNLFDRALSKDRERRQ